MRSLLSPQEVAPPRGERGLKCYWLASLFECCGRSPSWGAWIEIPIYKEKVVSAESLPLVGSVD